MADLVSIRDLPQRWSAQAPYTAAALRIVAAFLFICHGTMKLFGFPPGHGPVPLLSQAGFAGFLEVVGGTMVLLGLFTRPVAFVLSGEMAFAYFIAHAPKSFWPALNGGELAALYCFIWLYYSAAGAPVWSLDAWRAKHRSQVSAGRPAFGTMH